MAIKIHRDYKSNLVIIEGIETKSSPTGILTAIVEDTDYVTIVDRTSPSSQAEIYKRIHTDFVDANDNPAGTNAVEVADYLNSQFEPRLAITFFRGYSNTESAMVGLANPFEGDYVFRTDTSTLFYYSNAGQWVDSGLSFAPSPPVSPPITSPLVPPIVRRGRASLLADGSGYITSRVSTAIKFAEFEEDLDGIQIPLDGVVDGKPVFWGVTTIDRRINTNMAFSFYFQMEYVNQNIVRVTPVGNTSNTNQFTMNIANELRIQLDGGSNKLGVYNNGSLRFEMQNPITTPMFFYGRSSVLGAVIKTPLARLDPI